MSGFKLEGRKDGTERAGADETRIIDDGRDIGLALSSLHRAAAVDHRPLNDGQAQPPLAAIVCWLDRSGVGEEDDELIASLSDIGLEGSAQVAAALRDEDGAELTI